jgi:DNA repair photolyase/predicted NAD-dependent protein-ADP-ribosyltransferase YbiA (DUF1768 family)
MASKLKNEREAVADLKSADGRQFPPVSSRGTNGDIVDLQNGGAPLGNIGDWTIREDGKIGNKPLFLINSKAVLNTKSDFGHKLLCDGMTFTARHACVFSCAFCYVEALMRKNAKLNALLEHRGLKHEDVVVEIENPVAALRKQLLLANGQPRYNNNDPKDKRVVYASPLVDVVGSPAQVKITIELCQAILELTSWHIRLLSKSSLLVNVAKAFGEEKYKKRMIYGFSTGTLDDKLTQSFEIGTASVSGRLKALKQLQADGYRTFGMVCPIIPQEDYAQFAKELAEKIDIGSCEHVWAEVLNPRGSAMHDTSAAMRRKGFTAEADFVDKVSSDQAEWDRYAEQTFLALTKVIPAKKLRLLQYVDESDYGVWEKHEAKGAVLLGAHAKLMEEVFGDFSDVKTDEPLTKVEKEQLEANLETIRENVTGVVEVWAALKKIKDLRLYRETHKSFEAFCLATFDFGMAHGKRLVKAAEIVEELRESQAKMAPDGAILLPTTESQARELGKLRSEDRLKVLKLSTAKAKKAGGKNLNSVFIQLAAAEIAPPAKPVAKPEAHYLPPSYTTDLKVFLDWVATLKELAKAGEKKPLIQLLEKAEADKAIQPEMPELFKFTNADALNGWLNPMSPHPLTFKKKTYRTADSLFQWLRFEGHPEIQAEILADPSPISVRIIAKENRELLGERELKADLELMRQCLRLKIEQHPDLKGNLLATGDKLIVDDCTARQKGAAFFWGMANIRGQWVGDNWLGKLWMELRDKLKNF